MHNLLLGTGKHAFKVWIAKEILTEDSLKEIERRAKLIQVPSDVSRLPTNISSNYGGFKADQWRACITVYSPVVLKGILPPEHYLCWMIFVRACFILCQRILMLYSHTILVNGFKYCMRRELHYEFHLHLHLTL